MPLVRFILRLGLILSVPLFVSVITFIFLRRAFLLPLDPQSTMKITVEIAAGRNFADICRELKNKGVIKYAWALDALGRFRKADTKISAGEYELSPAMDPRSILHKLISGDVIKRQITVKEGFTIKDIARALETAGIIKAEDFEREASDPRLLSKAGISAASFEGYLFPETYFFSRPVSAQTIIWTMLEEGERHWPREFTEKAEKMRLSRHEVLTLASIIEKESGNVDEQPLISSVFHNRLSQVMKLQSDPTVIYGLPNFNGNLTKEDLQNPHPYNTYVNFGLPPGPIANPGLSAIKAALFPKQTTFLFFVADGSGKHVFSTTLAEHNEAVARFQKGP